MYPVLIRFCAISVPAPEELPVTPVDEVTIHENVVPLILEVRAIFVVFPEQIDVERGALDTSGIGLTITVITSGEPLQPNAFGVTV